MYMGTDRRFVTGLSHSSAPPDRASCCAGRADGRTAILQGIFSRALADPVGPPLNHAPDRTITEDALSDDNILKFERRKPKQEKKPGAPGPGKGLIWLAVVAAIALVWAYYQFIAPQGL